MIARIREQEEQPSTPPALAQARRLVAGALLPAQGRPVASPRKRLWRLWGLLASAAAVVALYAAHLLGLL